MKVCFDRFFSGLRFCIQERYEDFVGLGSEVFRTGQRYDIEEIRSESITDVQRRRKMEVSTTANHPSQIISVTDRV
jgi:hypothetical protein